MSSDTLCMPQYWVTQNNSNPPKMAKSIVEYFREHEGYRCGYCGSKDSNYSHGRSFHHMVHILFKDKNVVLNKMSQVCVIFELQS